MRRTVRALVMSGGGAKGAFELGAVYGLVKDLKLDFDVIAGVSAGALHAAVLAQGAGYKGLEAKVDWLWEQWKNIRGPRDFFFPRVLRSEYLSFVGSFLWTRSIYDPAPVRKRLADSVHDLELRASGKELRIEVVSLESGKPKVIDQDADDAASWTLASGSIPLQFPPVIRKGESFVDGGVRNITPFQYAFRALKKKGKEEDWLELFFVLASPVGPMLEVPTTNLRNGRQIAFRAVNILENQVYKEDVRLALDVTRSVRAFTNLTKQLAPPYPPALNDFPFRPPDYRDIEVYGIIPDKWYMDTLGFDPAKIQEAFDDGRAMVDSGQFYMGDALRNALAL